MALARLRRPEESRHYRPDGHDRNYCRSYAAIRSTLSKGVRAQPRLDDGGGFKITLDRHTLDRLKALRESGESYSDVILRLAAERRAAVAGRGP
jgi:hypothetical protein